MSLAEVGRDYTYLEANPLSPGTVGFTDGSNFVTTMSLPGTASIFSLGAANGDTVVVGNAYPLMSTGSPSLTRVLTGSALAQSYAIPQSVFQSALKPFAEVAEVNESSDLVPKSEVMRRAGATVSAVSLIALVADAFSSTVIVHPLVALLFAIFGAAFAIMGAIKGSHR